MQSRALFGLLLVLLQTATGLVAAPAFRAHGSATLPTIRPGPLVAQPRSDTPQMRLVLAPAAAASLAFIARPRALAVSAVVAVVYVAARYFEEKNARSTRSSSGEQSLSAPPSVSAVSAEPAAAPKAVFKPVPISESPFASSVGADKSLWTKQALKQLDNRPPPAAPRAPVRIASPAPVVASKPTVPVVASKPTVPVVASKPAVPIKASKPAKVSVPINPPKAPKSTPAPSPVPSLTQRRTPASPADSNNVVPIPSTKAPPTPEAPPAKPVPSKWAKATAGVWNRSEKSAPAAPAPTPDRWARRSPFARGQQPKRAPAPTAEPAPTAPWSPSRKPAPKPAAVVERAPMVVPTLAPTPVVVAPAPVVTPAPAVAAPAAAKKPLASRRRLTKWEKPLSLAEPLSLRIKNNK